MDLAQIIYGKDIIIKKGKQHKRIQANWYTTGYTYHQNQ